MTDEKKSSVRYLDRKDIETVHRLLSVAFEKQGEPIPSLSTASEENLDSLIKIPQTTFYGVEQYPTIESKAAIIFYTLNKKHIFSNGNKRMSVACFMIFLLLNKKEPVISQDELTKKAIWLANTTHEHNFDDIKSELVRWITEEVL